MQTAKEAQANTLGQPVEDPIFERGQENLRWSRFKDFEPELGIMSHALYDVGGEYRRNM